MESALRRNDREDQRVRGHILIGEEVAETSLLKESRVVENPLRRRVVWRRPCLQAPEVQRLQRPRNDQADSGRGHTVSSIRWHNPISQSADVPLRPQSNPHQAHGTVARDIDDGLRHAFTYVRATPLPMDEGEPSGEREDGGYRRALLARPDLVTPIGQAGPSDRLRPESCTARR